MTSRKIQSPRGSVPDCGVCACRELKVIALARVFPGALLSRIQSHSQSPRGCCTPGAVAAGPPQWPRVKGRHSANLRKGGKSPPLPARRTERRGGAFPRNGGGAKNRGTMCWLAARQADELGSGCVTSFSSTKSAPSTRLISSCSTTGACWQMVAYNVFGSAKRDSPSSMIQYTMFDTAVDLSLVKGFASRNNRW